MGKTKAMKKGKVKLKGKLKVKKKLKKKAHQKLSAVQKNPFATPAQVIKAEEGKVAQVEVIGPHTDIDHAIAKYEKRIDLKVFGAKKVLKKKKDVKLLKKVEAKKGKKAGVYKGPKSSRP